MGKINTDIYEVIKKSGTKGISFKEIMKTLGIDYKYVKNVIGGLLRSNLITCVQVDSDTRKFIAVKSGRQDSRKFIDKRY